MRWRWALGTAGVECAQMDEKGLTPEDHAALVAQIERLREEHRDLDAAIEALRNAGQVDQLQVQRLKKRKLLLRERSRLSKTSSRPTLSPGGRQGPVAEP